MNQKQREFLIGKIEAENKRKISALEGAIPDEPELEVYITRSILEKKLKMKPSEEIFQHLFDRVSNKTDSSHSLLDTENGFRSSIRGKVIKMKMDAICELPEDFIVKQNEYKLKKAAAMKEIREIQEGMETLITRIHLASNSVLDSLVGEIDDMGNLSLIDSTLKQIIAPAAQTPAQIGEGGKKD